MKEEDWPKHKSHKWHDKSEWQTTLCYLTLPKNFGATGFFDPSEMEADSMVGSLHCAQALKIDLPTLTGTAKMRTQFLRAMRILDLQPLPHPSQSSKRATGAHKPAGEVSANSLVNSHLKDGNGL